MDQLPIVGLEPPSGAPEKKRGRPPGAKNKASGDLRKYIAATTGSTPGQQLADLVMVTQKDMRAGRRALQDMGQDVRAYTPMMMGYWWRRRQLMALFGWSEQYADGVMARLTDMLMPYVHQGLGKAEAEKVDTRPMILADTVPLGSKGNPTQVTDMQGEMTFGLLSVAHGPSHNGEKA